ncbi:hypothetical protein TVAG_019500 [Trichomonas vaginalis G3]|uniref:Leucine Rich Repeat family protein n=1 Tax=Trichomonas vaginalis (strain ATCC PRA-98 / G3) TaxID=412133 RepID=A2DX23_TRIV3|nr:leucine-rich repeat, isoform f-related family [Trichomonas vaginalis G3]EAY15050.1 hypothetical protein TVAG_019500 [Trichomonas vaginalis G3]KAI5549591.1 leucine-rich repeat, isoform f-related family [Trichomonas vaginalis G3]|eukprot:XP_001327273.1 hypothetical protein [Trichomonas vaginalis G3]
MEEKISKAREIVSSTGHNVIYSDVCYQNSISVDKSQSIILLTDYNLYFFNSILMKISLTFPWLEIKYYNPQESHIDIRFPRFEFFISSNNLENIIKNIDFCLTQIFTPDELHNLNQNHFNKVKFSKSGPSTLIRYSEYCHIHSKSVSPNNISILSDILSRQRTTLDNSYFSDPISSLDSIIYSTEIIPWINKLVLHDFPYSNLSQQFSRLSSLFRHFQHIEFISSTHTNIKHFTESILSSHSTHISGITFDKLKLTEETINSIYNLFSGLKLPSLGLCYTQIPQFFYKNFFKLNINLSLKFLSLDNCSGIDLDLLMENINDVSVLSLENCSLEIYDILFSISKYKIESLKVINVSRNKASLMPFAGFNLPSKLFSFAANSVQWSENTFRNLVGKILVSPGICKIAFSGAVCSEKEMKAVTTLMSRSSCTSIQSLTWNDNPINMNLFDFIKKNEKMQFLALAGCFHEKQSKIAVNLLNYLESKPSNLSTLIIRGNDKCYLGRLLPNILVSAASCPKLKHLDVSFSRAGNKGAAFIEKLYSAKTHIEEFCIDGLSPITFPSIMSLLKVACKSKIKTTFPFKDVEKLVQSGRISKEESEEAKNLMKKSYSSIDSPLTKPFFLYEDNYENSFPKYATRDECEVLSKINEKVKENEEIFVNQETEINDEQTTQAYTVATRDIPVQEIVKKRDLSDLRPEPLIVPHLETTIEENEENESVEERELTTEEGIEIPSKFSSERERRNIRINVESVQELPTIDILQEFQHPL